MIRDQNHDPSYSLLFHLLQERPGIADFVKSAELDDNQLDTLPDSAFAWPERRLFPIDTAENTVLSSLYREKTAAVPANVDDLLARARAVYGVKDLWDRSQAHVKTAAAAPVEETWILPRHKRLRIKTAEDVKTAEKVLLEQYPRLSIEDRAEGFINLVKVARDKNVALAPRTHQMAGMTVCTAKTAADFIECRRMATSEPLFQRAYEKLAAAFKGRGIISDRDELVKVADAVAKVDRLAGLEGRYDKTLPDPIQTVFNTTKLAEEMVNLAGREIELSKLAAMPATFWGDIVGDEMLSEITDGGGGVDASKLAAVISTLPLDLKIILKNQVP